MTGNSESETSTVQLKVRVFIQNPMRTQKFSIDLHTYFAILKEPSKWYVTQARTVIPLIVWVTSYLHLSTASFAPLTSPL